MTKTPETAAEALAAIAEQYGISVEEVLKVIDDAVVAVAHAKHTFH
jgi:hypothetical protein